MTPTRFSPRDRRTSVEVGSPLLWKCLTLMKNDQFQLIKNVSHINLADALWRRTKRALLVVRRNKD